MVPNLKMLKFFTIIILTKVIGNLCLEQFNEYQTIVLPGVPSKNYSITVDETKEYLIRFPVSSSKYPYIVFAWSYQTFFDHPALIVTKQQREVTSWELPLSIKTKTDMLQFSHTSRTLCHNNMDIIAELPRNSSEIDVPINLHKHLSVSVSTSSKIPTTIELRVEEQTNFYIEENDVYSTIVTPSQPKFFYYKFYDDNHENSSNTVILEVEANNNTCMTVAVENVTCPVTVLKQDISLHGKLQTISTKGGIIIKKHEFPNGFFVVFVVKGDNYDCSQESSAIPQYKSGVVSPLNRSTFVNFSIKPGLTQDDYVFASLIALVVILFFIIIIIILTCIFHRFTKEEEVIEDISMQSMEFMKYPDNVDVKLDSTNLMLNALATKKPEYFEKKSFTYLWHVISIAIFYGIPVVQLVVTYQRIVNVSGNQDFCYYNFLCANPVLKISDFNHVYSNIGYVLIGILFLFIIFYRQRYVIHKKNYGIPKHYGLFYAMGIALIMEGVLSACYHICPNQSNFQFDTSFMYVMATLCMVQIYQKRHPDINATAYATFVLLGLAIFSAMLGILNGDIIIWVLFVICYIALCLFLSFNIYFMSYIKQGFQRIEKEWKIERNIYNAIKPKRKAHFIILVVANVLNISFVNLGFLSYFRGTDFATFLLGLLMGNTMLYMVVYITMKLVHHEKIGFQPATFGILGLATWLGAGYFFINNTSMWTETAAESREWNAHCLLMEFYDYHDIWHFLSAPALFFSFMMILTIDDDLVNTLHADIAVF